MIFFRPVYDCINARVWVCERKRWMNISLIFPSFFKVVWMYIFCCDWVSSLTLLCHYDDDDSWSIWYSKDWFFLLACWVQEILVIFILNKYSILTMECRMLVINVNLVRQIHVRWLNKSMSAILSLSCYHRKWEFFFSRVQRCFLLVCLLAILAMNDTIVQEFHSSFIHSFREE